MKSPLSFALLSFLSFPFAAAHTYLGCTDYRGGVNTFDFEKCHSYARDAISVGALEIPFGGAQGIADEGAGIGDWPTCARGPSRDKREWATYESGGVYCVAWPVLGHMDGGCFRNGEDDWGVRIFVSNKKSNITEKDYVARPLPTNFGVHTNGEKDCLGYQRAPDFCKDDVNGRGNHDHMATGCFRVDVPPGDYALVFRWDWSDEDRRINKHSYINCFDAHVVEPGTSELGEGSLEGVGDVEDHLRTGNGDTCRNNWARVQGDLNNADASQSTLSGKKVNAAGKGNPSIYRRANGKKFVAGGQSIFKVLS